MKLNADRIAHLRDEASVRLERANALLREAESRGDVSAADTLRREVNQLSGYHNVLVEVFDKHCRFPVEPGTILHGIDVSKLDWRTRAMVMSRNLATIYALGGRPDPE